MSYCRFAWGGSDVYVYDDCSFGLYCCGCKLFDGVGFAASADGEATVMTIPVMVEHLLIHRREGHTVPQHALDALLLEQREEYGLGLSYLAWQLSYWWRSRVWNHVTAWACRKFGHRDVTAFPGHEHFEHLGGCYDGNCPAERNRTCGRCGRSGFRGDGVTQWY